MYKYIIVAVNPQQGSVEVIYFHESTPIFGDKPSFFIGPLNVDLPIDPKTNQPIAGDVLHRYLSNACPSTIIDRDLQLRTAAQLDMGEHQKQIGIMRDVEKTSPKVTYRQV